MKVAVQQSYCSAQSLNWAQLAQQSYCSALSLTMKMKVAAQ
jgi:hypothetical protein